MRVLEVRRHTIRAKPGQHLSQAGVTLARRVGEQIGPFDRVITSDLPRAFETAIAMGFAVDKQYAELSTFGQAVEDEIGGWPAPCIAYSEAFKRGGVTAEFAANLSTFWQQQLTASPENSHLLIVSHGGVIELGAVGCFPNADHAAWGNDFGYCEGVRLHFDGTHFTEIEILRVEQGN